MFTAAWNLQGNQLQCLHQPGTFRANNYYVYTSLEPSGQPTTMLTPPWSLQGNQLQCLHQLEPSGQPTTMCTPAWNLQGKKGTLHQPGTLRASNYNLHSQVSNCGCKGGYKGLVRPGVNCGCKRGYKGLVRPGIKLWMQAGIQGTC